MNFTAATVVTVLLSVLLLAVVSPIAKAQLSNCFLPCNSSGPVCASNILQCGLFNSVCEVNLRNCANFFLGLPPYVPLANVTDCNGIRPGTREDCVRNCPALVSCNNTANITCTSNANGTLCGLFRSDCQRVRRGCSLNEVFVANSTATCLGVPLGNVGRCQ